MTNPLLVGAVVYDPKVAVIWEIIQNYFAERGCAMDTVFYTNYELQVTALLAGHLDLAWNSPLAWLDAERRSGGTCRAIAMRDTDRDRVTHIVARTSAGLKGLADLRGRSLATGAADSPQATLIPLGLLQKNALEPGRDVEIRRHDVLVGKHGDHVGGERDALQEVVDGTAAASAVLDLNWEAWCADGSVPASQLEVVATTDRFDHCVFTAAKPESSAEADWTNVLLAMDYEDLIQREVMDMEGLRAWLPGRTTGFSALADAVHRQGYFES